MSIHTLSPKVVIYKVDPTSQVTARVLIGDGQRGGWAIGFDQATVKKGSSPDQVAIGTGPAIKDRLLQVTTTVVDVRIETNRLSAVLTLAGGPQGDMEVPQAYDDGTDGDTAIFTTLVLFQ